jgi:hypothetical protein
MGCCSDHCCCQHCQSIGVIAISSLSLSDEPSSFVNIELHQTFASHFQQQGLAGFLIHDIGAFHDLIDFERLLAERAQDILSVIQHDLNSNRRRRRTTVLVDRAGLMGLETTAQLWSDFRAQAQPPGTEVLDAETGRQKYLPKRANARRDQKPTIERPEIPAETPYPASCRNRKVCKGWMVVYAVRYEPVSNGNSLLSGNFAKFANFALSLAKIEATHQALISEFPKKVNREFVRSNSEFRAANREV